MDQNHYLFESQLLPHQLKHLLLVKVLKNSGVYLHQLLLLLEYQVHLFDLFPQQIVLYFLHLMQNNLVDACITGTDRTTANGDVCNKIGTYLKALAAKDNNIPFYVAAPISSIDFALNNGLKQIPIEMRNEKEISHIMGLNKKGNLETVQAIPSKANCINYAFDVTPAKYITKLITEKGIVDANSSSIKELK